MVKLVRYIYFPHQNALQTKTPAQLRNADGLRENIILKLIDSIFFCLNKYPHIFENNKAEKINKNSNKYKG